LPPLSAKRFVEIRNRVANSAFHITEGLAAAGAKMCLMWVDAEPVFIEV
jgi:hypothetical protein